MNKKLLKIIVSHQIKLTSSPSSLKKIQSTITSTKIRNNFIVINSKADVAANINKREKKETQIERLNYALNFILDMKTH